MKINKYNIWTRAFNIVKRIWVFTHIKKDHIIKLKKTLMFICLQTVTLIPSFFLEILHFRKYLFSVFWVCLTTPSQKRKSSWRKMWYLLICKKWTWFLTSFLRCYTLKNPLIDWPRVFWTVTWETEFCYIKRSRWNINNSTNYHFGLSI